MTTNLMGCRVPALWAGLHTHLEHAPPLGVPFDIVFSEIERDAPACMPGARRASLLRRQV